MYRILLERAAEKDLARLSNEMHDRVITAICGVGDQSAPGRLPETGRWRERLADSRGRLPGDL
jgi:hypothetical protein